MFKKHTVYTVTQFIPVDPEPHTAPFTLLTNRDEVFDALDKRCPEWREDMFRAVTPVVQDGWADCHAFVVTDEYESQFLIFTIATHDYSSLYDDYTDD